MPSTSFHLEGRFPDVAVNDPRDRLFAVIEAQRGRADDQHIAKLAAHYVPRSGARLGILVAEGWGCSSAAHSAWAVWPAPVVVVVALDALHELDYQVAGCTTRPSATATSPIPQEVGSGR